MRRSPAAGAGIPTTFEGASCPILQEPWKNAPSSIASAGVVRSARTRAFGWSSIRSVATTVPRRVPLTESLSTWISASTSAFSPTTSSLPAVIFPSNFPSIRNASSNLRSPLRWLPRSRNPFNVASSVFPFIDPFLPGSIRPDSFDDDDDRSGPPRPPSGAREPLVETHELFFRTERDLDPSSAAAAHDPQARAQPTGELLLGVAGERIAAAFSPKLIRSSESRDAPFGLPDREPP